MDGQFPYDLYTSAGVRPDIPAAIQRVWENLTRPGEWLTSAEKLAIAAEVRAAQRCSLCRERKAALSPYGVNGSHDSASPLDPTRIDSIHRVVTDPGRLSRRLVTDLAATGVSDAEFVELLGVALFTMTVDIFHRTLGLGLLPFPQAQPGEPSRKRPSQVEDIGAWVPVLSARNPEIREIFAQALRISNVARAMSLAPSITRIQAQLVQALYIPVSAIASTADSGRAISRPQIELIASRVSALNECFY